MNLESRVSRRNFLSLFVGTVATVSLSACVPQSSEGAKESTISKQSDCIIQDSEQEISRLAQGKVNSSLPATSSKAQNPVDVVRAKEDRMLQNDTANLERLQTKKDKTLGLAKVYGRIAEVQYQSAEDSRGINYAMSEEYRRLADCNGSRHDSLIRLYLGEVLLKQP